MAAALPTKADKRAGCGRPKGGVLINPFTVAAILVALAGQQVGWLSGHGQPLQTALVAAGAFAFGEVVQELFSRMRRGRR